jgi:hypothetical protein
MHRRDARMKLVKEIEILLDELLAVDQPTDEMARQVLSLIRHKDLSEIIDD